MEYDFYVSTSTNKSSNNATIQLKKSLWKVSNKSI